MKSLTAPLMQLEMLTQAAEKLNKETGVQLLTGCIDSQKTHLAFGLGQHYKKRLIITYHELKAQEIFEEYRLFDKEVYLYPAKDFLFFHADIQGNLLEEQRMHALQALMEEKTVTIVTTIDGCMGKVKPLEDLKDQVLNIDMDSIVDLEKLKATLSGMGYERAGQVETKGQFSVRGGIIDIYPLTEDVPVRIELWDEEIDSIRSFDPESQRSIENLDEITIYPAKEPEVSLSKGSVSFLEYFADDDGIVFLDEPNRLAEKADAVSKEFFESIQNRIAQGKAAPEEAHNVLSVSEVFAKLERIRCAALCMLDTKPKNLAVNHKFSLEVKGIGSYQNSFELLTKDLKRWKKEKYRIVLLCSSKTRAKRLAQDLQDENLNAFYTDEKDREVNP